MNSVIKKVTNRIIERSQKSRSLYLKQIQEMEDSPDSDRSKLSCSNLAHAVAASDTSQKKIITSETTNSKTNLAIISSYNDMLSAHQPYEKYPQIIKSAAKAVGASAQFAGGVPAMCDGITQGREGMELSLLSRDVIAMSTSIGLSHGVYDGVLCLGICDKIVPGLLMGALTFGFLPTIFLPAGPMTSGIPNDHKAKVRKDFALGKISRKQLLDSEMQSYHGPGTCTFYGTANSNQMLMEVMGLHIPGSAFINPHDDLRYMLTVYATEKLVAFSRQSKNVRPIGKIIDEKSFVNAIVALHATGGSTNHTLHLPAIASTAGIKITWEDFAEISEVTPLLAKIYPNGSADVNQFHAAGGMSYIISELLNQNLLHNDVKTIFGESLEDYTKEPFIEKNNELNWGKRSVKSLDNSIIRPVNNPFRKNGGLKMLSGNIGKSVIKVSSIDESQCKISAQAMVFKNEQEVKEAFNQGKLDRNVIIVVRFQGPKANGMPELHGLTPLISVIQEKGFNVAVVTDGRMSGASGKIPSAIHVCPEAADGGNIGVIKNGDKITIDLINGSLNVEADLNAREKNNLSNHASHLSFGRSLFYGLRNSCSSAEEGGGINLIKGME